MTYQHHPLELAGAEFNAGQRQRFQVTRIEWTFAAIRDRRHQVHKNAYRWALRKVIQLTRETKGD